MGLWEEGAVWAWDGAVFSWAMQQQADGQANSKLLLPSSPGVLLLSSLLSCPVLLRETGSGGAGVSYSLSLSLLLPVPLIQYHTTKAPGWLYVATVPSLPRPLFSFLHAPSSRLPPSRRQPVQTLPLFSLLAAATILCV